MSRKYFTPLPDRPNVPEYVMKHYCPADYLRTMIQWSIQEFRKGRTNLARTAHPNTFRMFIEEYSPMRVLAESERFQELLSFINERNYNELTGRERVFLRRAYELFRALGSG